MKLSKLNLNDLCSLYQLLISFNEYVVKQVRLNEQDANRHNKWIQLHIKLQDKIKMIYNEINSRIDSIEE